METSDSIDVGGIGFYSIDWSNYYNSEETFLVDEALNDMEFGIFCDRFRDEKIDFEALMIMNSHHINRVLHDVPVGVVIKFERALDNWRKLNGQPITEFLSTQNEPTNSLEVKTILNSSDAGKEFLQKFSSTKIVNNSDRQMLIKILNGYFGDKKIILGIEQIEAISYDIKSVFPNETSSYYFDRVEGRATGALYIAHNNMLKKMRKLKMIPSTRKRKNEEKPDSIAIVDNVVFSSDEIFSSNFVKQSTANIPLEILNDHWKKSFRVRRHSYKNDKSVMFTELYRVLERPDATFLINIDFDMMYPNTNINFREEWFKVEGKLVETLLCMMKKNSQSKSLKNMSSLTNNQKVAVIISSLHSFLFSPTVIFGKSNYKSTIPDTLQSFLFLDPDESTKDIRMKEWEENLGKRKLNPQAYIIGFGYSYESIGDKFCVKVDNIQYVFESNNALIDAIELLMKIFHVFDLQYPALNANVHLFLSKLFFQIPNDTKKLYARIEQLISELK